MVFEGSERVFCLSPAGGALPSFGDSHLGSIGRESRAQTLNKGEWPAGGATGQQQPEEATGLLKLQFIADEDEEDDVCMTLQVLFCSL